MPTDDYQYIAVKQAVWGRVAYGFTGSRGDQQAPSLVTYGLIGPQGMPVCGHTDRELEHELYPSRERRKIHLRLHSKIRPSKVKKVRETESWNLL